eukprot:CAMPEP_0181487370 /NCGR_PEP_ID=MMETSP1110-20121109/47774_1 /TAXON_ID=174948 /ORGANISM="Symbiodinium sp., Strain CCMP421" /LENGTH=71 /DNA_ID=CAMNT_0023613855 /DNA_START=57 /DNA_END=272 /DNA_ORIENTATION=+
MASPLKSASDEAGKEREGGDSRTEQDAQEKAREAEEKAKELAPEAIQRTETKLFLEEEDVKDIASQAERGS